SAAADAPTIALEWKHTVMGSGIGATGLHIVDLDGDGRREIVAGANSRSDFGADDFWYVLSHTPQGYVQTFASPIFPNGITAFGVADVADDGDLDVLVASGSVITIHDGSTLAPVRTIPTAASRINSFRIADVDGDGALEIVLCDSNDAWVYA